MDEPEYGICKECNQPNTTSKWCNTCNAKRFQQNFKNWTSGNHDIDKFIQDTQLSATRYRDVLEWIPYDNFYNIKYITKGGFGKVYRTIWIYGYITNWDNINKNWHRPYPNKNVVLKSLYNSKNITLEFLNEIISHYKLDNCIGCYIIRFYGITQDPETKDYMIVLKYAENGSLRNYLNTSYDKISWRDKILNLYNIACGLNSIHKKEFIHRDLHIGNILVDELKDHLITDMGLCKPANYNNASEDNIYGVLPYIAPEVLRERNYTKSADIYSFGIIMYEVISGLPPYFDVSHDKILAIRIFQGLRPRFNIKIPQLIVHLIKRCLDANPLNRPTSKEIFEIFNEWKNEVYYQTELGKQIEEADKINKNSQTSSLSSTHLSLSYKTHPEAIYTSRLLNFNNLPEPKNSNDYYEKNDNIISMEFSDSLQIDISQWQ